MLLIPGLARAEKTGEEEQLPPYTYTGMIDIDMDGPFRLGLVICLEDNPADAPPYMTFPLNLETVEVIFAQCAVGDICTITGEATLEDKFGMFFDIEAASLKEKMSDYLTRKNFLQKLGPEKFASIEEDAKYKMDFVRERTGFGQ